MGTRTGHLVIVGGHEEREGHKAVLRRFVDLAGPGRASRGPVHVLTAATEAPDEVWRTYAQAFRSLGVSGVKHLQVDYREQANDPAVWEPVAEASGVFITGGSQKKLIALLGGTRLCDTLRHAYMRRGTCIAGTSAGASALSEHMLSEAAAEDHPLSADVRLVTGLGFLLNAVIDQHFSQRGRLPRLLSVVAHNPKLFGVGIDEDTALVIARGQGIEVLGSGAVTVVDGRDMRTRLVGEPDREVFRATDVRLHVLPAGDRIRCGEDTQGAEVAGYPPSLQSLVTLLCGDDAVDTQFRHA
jgi:cyanophycinase